jgi:uncharacterized membrane protein YjjP (DUF1212 family)
MSASPTDLTADPRFEFLKALAGALAPLGQTSGELQEQIEACSTSLGLDVQAFVLPTSVQLNLEALTGSHTAYITIRTNTVDLETLASLQEIAVAVAGGRMLPEEGRLRVRTLVMRPPRFPVVLNLLAGLLCTAAIAVLLGGGLNEILAALPTGLAVGLFYRITRRSRRFQGVLELSSAAFATAIALGLGYALDDFDFTVVIVAAIVQFLPGLRLTQGVSELAAGDLVAGTARLGGAVMTLMNLGIGVGLVFAIFVGAGDVPKTISAGGSELWMVAIAIPFAAAGFAVIENARRRDVGWVFLGVVIATLTSRFGTQLLGAIIGVGIAALVVGLAGNAYSRYLHHPKATVTVPGITILVPGALGLQGIFALLNASVNNASNAGALAVQTVLIAMALVVGLTLSESFLRPRSLPDIIEEDEAAEGGAPDAPGAPQHAKKRMPEDATGFRMSGTAGPD